MESYKVVSTQSVLVGEKAYNQHDIVEADPTSEQVQALVENGQIVVFSPSAEEVAAGEVSSEEAEPTVEAPEVSDESEKDAEEVAS